MPGAYTKQMQGERYERLVALIKECEEHLVCDHEMSKEQLRRKILLIILLVATYSKSAIEEFCYAGGFHLFCRILKEYNGKPFDIGPILKFFTIVMTQQVDPYDNDLGTMPMLSYFLCERHTHYVDIEWNAEELQLTQLFLDAFIARIASEQNANDPLAYRLSAINVLSNVLVSYPPHRVAPSAAAVFDKKRCSNLFTALENIAPLWETPAGWYRVAQVVCSIASFGLGSYIAADLPLAHLLLTLNHALLPETRCPCSRCELFRRLQRVARERDEFGISKAADAKKTICYALLQSHMLPLLERLLNCLAEHYDASPAEVDAHTESSSSSSIRSDADDKASDNELDDETTAGRTFPITSLHQRSDYTPDLSNPNQLADQTLRMIALTLLLCASAYEDVYNGESILSYSNDAMAIGLLKALKFKDFRLLCDTATMELSPGVRTAIQVLCTLALRAPEAQKQQLRLRLKPTIEVFLQKTFNHLTDICGPLSRGWKPPMAHLAPTHAIMLVLVAQATEKPSRTKVYSPLSPPVMASALAAVAAYKEGYEWAGSAADERVFIGSVLASMAVLTGTDQYIRCPEHRRRLIAAPDPRTGFMASTARWLMNKFDEKLSGGEGCVVVRTLSSLVISRAEKASALISQLPRQTAAPDQTAITGY